MTPFAAGLGPFIDMDNEDFIGRKALLDAARSTRLFGLTCAATTPGRGSEILDGDTVVDQMTAGVDSPTLKCGLGCARFDEPDDWAGRSLRIRLPGGAEHPCEIVDLPFFDRDKRLVRGFSTETT